MDKQLQNRYKAFMNDPNPMVSYITNEEFQELSLREKRAYVKRAQSILMVSLGSIGILSKQSQEIQEYLLKLEQLFASYILNEEEAPKFVSANCNPGSNWGVSDD